MDPLIKPITALHLYVLSHGRVRAILSAFRSMKLDVNLHFWGLAAPMRLAVMNERQMWRSKMRRFCWNLNLRAICDVITCINSTSDKRQREVFKTFLKSLYYSLAFVLFSTIKLPLHEQLHVLELNKMYSGNAIKPFFKIVHPKRSL